jgi:23S rRNA pseudouridine1911/1915/1917 synthase
MPLSHSDPTLAQGVTEAMPLDADPIEAVEDGVLPCEQRDLEVSVQQAGMRLDRFLAEHISEFSRNYLQQLIDDGAVFVDEVCVNKSALRLKFPQRVQVTLRPTPQTQAYRAQQMPIETVYVDEHVRIIHKPAGLVVHPAPGNWDGTLLNGLLALDPSAASLPRAGIVHRLDKDTSGLMMVARTRQAMDALVAAIAARSVRREYLALAHGAWRHAGTHVARGSIGRDPHNRLRMAVLDEQRFSAKPACTTFVQLASNDRFSLVHCLLDTGRTHQIRVHMAHAGHPLLGDLTYGGKADLQLHRQALHAFKLSLDHPIIGQRLVFTAAPSADMQTAIDLAGLSYNLALLFGQP